MPRAKMPRAAKKLKSTAPTPEPQSAPAPKSPSPTPARSLEPVARLPAAAQEEDNQYVKVARAHWLNPVKKNAKVKVKNDILKTQIWEPLAAEGFPYKTLLLLENLQVLESYLWPGFSEASSHIHVALIALITNVKGRERVETWDLFRDRPDEFSVLFRRILALTLDATQCTAVRTQILSFLIFSFQSLDHELVRRECAPLVKIAVWHNISQDTARELKLNAHPYTRKVWRASIKRYEAADEATKARMQFERSWLYSLTLQFLVLLQVEESKPDEVTYCERFTEFLCDILSQLPTRQYVNTLLQDLHVIPVMSLSPMLNDDANSLLRDLHALLTHYTFFLINDQSGVQLSNLEAREEHNASLKQLQRVAFRHFKEKLMILALSNLGAIDQREELRGLLEPLSDDELLQLATYLDLRTSYPRGVALQIDRKLLMEVFLAKFEHRKVFRDAAGSINVLPTGTSLFDNRLLRTDGYDGTHPLPLPKLNLQYLSTGDFLWRSFILYHCESFYAIKRDVELALARIKPFKGEKGDIQFSGSSKMALPSSNVSILEVVPPLVGEVEPSAVRAELTYDLRRLEGGARRDWDSLRPDDVVFLLSVDTPPKLSRSTVLNDSEEQTEAGRLGIQLIRTAEVIQVLDDQDRPVRPGMRVQSSRRKLQVKLDAISYVADTEQISRGGPETYSRINLILRRHSRENNFKRVLQAIRALMHTETPLPPWIREIFLGCGDPASGTHKRPSNRVAKIDARDTFLDWQHLVDSLPGRVLEPDDEVTENIGPPFVLETVERPPATAEVKGSKKRRRDADPASGSDAEIIKVSTYRPLNCGPYPVDAPKFNSVRFTPSQVEAIMSGTQPGLTVIVGPPGTGKTDVATQIISNLYHNFPDERTLLITHSNQALNQLFAKIVALDINGRHLLRLGHGEDELETDSDFSRHGRVESFLENRDRYLEEVKRLAASIRVPGAHGNSVESAGYFDQVHIRPRWKQFELTLDTLDASAADIVDAFPFHDYFSTAPQPLFPSDTGRDAVVEIARGCHRHIVKIFTELADAQPFEILRRDKDKADYLLTAQARIIAMTSTHAAMRRAEIAALGFQYHNVVMEEAAQITEIESFMPLVMQKFDTGQASLRRIVLCGDHLQNSPVVQNIAYRYYANLESSLFSRLVRLGVPTISLDQQGRARASIAALYAWRYRRLENLPHVLEQREFLQANAGFKFDYQFIDVADYKGRGESEPSPHFIQNLGEAEYAVAIYQYMRLLGYPASRISILTTYAGQRALVRDVLTHRCAKHPVFGMPRIVATVDRYQGEQNDYVILSLTRTSKIGYLRDIRRMTVALSRARLGLYVLGRRALFESLPEFAPAFDLMFKRPDQLMLVTGELWPTERPVLEQNRESDEVSGEVPMVDVRHIGEYVAQMTRTKLATLQREAMNSHSNVNNDVIASLSGMQDDAYEAMELQVEPDEDGGDEPGERVPDQDRVRDEAGERDDHEEAGGETGDGDEEVVEEEVVNASESHEG